MKANIFPTLRYRDGHQAIAWLEREKSVPKGLKVRDWTQSRSLERLGLFSFAARGAQLLHLDGLSRLLDQGDHFAQEHMLDGLVSIWQIGGTN